MEKWKEKFACIIASKRIGDWEEGGKKSQFICSKKNMEIWNMLSSVVQTFFMKLWGLDAAFY